MNATHVIICISPSAAGPRLCQSASCTNEFDDYVGILIWQSTQPDDDINKNRGHGHPHRQLSIGKCILNRGANISVVPCYRTHASVALVVAQRRTSATVYKIVRPPTLQYDIVSASFNAVKTPEREEIPRRFDVKASERQPTPTVTNCLHL